MEKYKVSTIAQLLGVAQKTVYRMIDRKELKTCQERVNNREITLIMLNDKQLNELTQKYNSQEGQNSVNDVDDVNNVNILTGQSVNETEYKGDYLDKLQSFVLEVNDRHNQDVKEYVDRLVTAQSQALYLEDKQKGQEALYLNEINNLTRDKNTLMKLSIAVISFLSLLLITFLSLYIMKLNNPTVVEKIVEKPVPQVITATTTPKVSSKKNYKKK